MKIIYSLLFGKHNKVGITLQYHPEYDAYSLDELFKKAVKIAIDDIENLKDWDQLIIGKTESQDSGLRHSNLEIKEFINPTDFISKIKKLILLK